MARRLPGNPELAYQLGKKEGKELGYAAGYRDGGMDTINLARNFAALAVYNISNEFTRSEKKANELVLAFCLEQERLYGDEFYGDQDKVMQAVEYVKRIYRKIGFLQKEGGENEK